jgi:hypothetical protein
MFVAVLAVVLAATFGNPSMLAQRAGNASPAGKTYKARLAPVPIDVAMQATISGSGTVSAVLTGSTLSIEGSFEGLRSPATVAHVHMGQRGVRGPAFFDLTISNATSGTISGAIQLTSVQVAALERGMFYIQLHSEKAPDGNLWGWLLQPEVKR